MGLLFSIVGFWLFHPKGFTCMLISLNQTNEFQETENCRICKCETINISWNLFWNKLFLNGDNWMDECKRISGECPKCEGRGWVLVRGIVESAFLTWMDACPVCSGSGKKTKENRSLKWAGIIFLISIQDSHATHTCIHSSLSKRSSEFHVLVRLLFTHLWKANKSLNRSI